MVVPESGGELSAASRQRGLARVVGGVAGAHSRLHPPSAGGAKNSAGIRAAQIGNRRIGPCGGAVRPGLPPPRDYRTADEAPTRFWRALFDRTDDVPDAEERDDLQAHAQHLRGTIARLKRRPLQRLHAWIHAASCAIGLGRRHCGLWRGACARHRRVAGARPSGLGGRIERRRAPALAWYPLDARLFYANAVAAGFAIAAAALFYLLRRARLRRDYALEICAFEDLAYSDPLRPAEPPEEDQAAFEPSQWTGSQREQRQRHLVCRARPVIGRDHRGRQGRL